MHHKMLKLYLILAISGLTLLIITIVGINSSSVSNKDVEAIKDVLIKAETIADRAYIDLKELEKTYTLEGQTSTPKEQETKEAMKDNLINIYTDEFNNVFSEKANINKNIWIDKQVTNVIEGPDCIDCGISNIDIKNLSINDNVANVTVVLSKYLIDRVNVDEKIYLDKMKAEDLVKAKLIHVNDKWLIDQYSLDPQFGEVNHTLTHIPAP